MREGGEGEAEWPRGDQGRTQLVMELCPVSTDLWADVSSFEMSGRVMRDGGNECGVLYGAQNDSPTNCTGCPTAPPPSGSSLTRSAE